MLSDNIKQQRSKKGLTQDELANLSGVSRSTIAKYEAGFFKDIPLKTLVRIANGLKVPVLRLMK